MKKIATKLLTVLIAAVFISVFAIPYMVFADGDNKSISSASESAKPILTITAIDQTYTYTGKAQGPGDTAYEDPAEIAEVIHIKGLNGDDAITSVILDGQATDVGEHTDELVPSGVTVNGDPAEDSYDVIYVYGKITIDPNVNVKPGSHMTEGDNSGDLSQGVKKDDTMTPVILTADEGYYFPEDYDAVPVNGIGVTRDTEKQITVAGTLTGGEAEIMLPDAVKEPAPAYTVTYNHLNGASNSNPLTYIISDTPITLAPLPDVEGFAFRGWYDNADFNGSAVTKIPEGSTGDKEFFAKWTPISYFVTVTKGEASKRIAAFGESVTVTANEPETGQQFKEWTATGITLTDEQKTSASFTFTMPANAVTLTATYTNNVTPATYTKVGGAVIWDGDDDVDGAEVEYSVTEDPVADYETEIIGFSVTNTYAPIVDVVGIMSWDDGDNRTGARPESVTVRLFANGTGAGTQEVKPGGFGIWSFSFDDLPILDNNGQKINYTLSVDEIPGYNSSVGRAGDYAFRIMNTLIVDPDEKTPAQVDEAPEAYDLTYNGEGQMLVKEGSASGGTMMYALSADAETAPPSESFEARPPVGTDAGDHHVWYYVKGDVFHTDTVPKCVAAKIAKHPAAITVDSASKIQGEDDPVCTGTVEGLIAEGDLGEVSYKRTNDDEAPGTYEGVLTAEYTENANYDVSVTKGDFTIRKLFTLVWLDGDGSMLQTRTYGEGDEPPAYDGNEPTKAETAQYTYAFSGWDNGTVDGTTTTYKPLFSETVNKYTVTFVDYDGKTVLKEAVSYDYGTAAADIALPDDPEREPDAQYTYTFTGWTPEITDVTADAVYTAVYSSDKQSYTITWLQDDGTKIDQTTVEYGETPAHADPTKAADKEYTYTFAGWDPEVTKVTGGATYKATYTKEPIPAKKGILTFDLAGGMLDGKTGKITVEANVGNTIKLPGAPAREGYTFQYWKGSRYEAGAEYKVEGDHTFTAVWEENKAKTYTVTFNANGGSGTMEDVTGISGEYTLPTCLFTAPEDKAFDCWLVEGKEYNEDDPITVEADITVTAQWKEVAPVHVHSLKLVEAVEAACTEDGNTAYYVCDGCGLWFEDAAALVEITDKSSVIIKAFGHKWDNGVVTKEATYTREGIRTFTCLKDSSHTKEEPIPKKERRPSVGSSGGNSGSSSKTSGGNNGSSSRTSGKTAAKTGDNSLIGLWLMLMAASMLELVLAAMRRKKLRR